MLPASRDGRRYKYVGHYTRESTVVLSSAKSQAYNCAVYSHWQSLQTLICPATSNINLVVQFSRPPSQCTYIYWWYLFYMYRTLRQNYIRFGSHHIFVFPIQWYLEELRFWYHWTGHAWKQPHSPWRLSWHAYTYIRFRSRHLCTSGKKGTTDIGI